jgi:hypothetical protein
MERQFSRDHHENPHEQAVASPPVAERAPCAGACSFFCGGPTRGTSRSEASGRPPSRKAVLPLPPAKKEYRRKRWRGRRKPSTAAPEARPQSWQFSDRVHENTHEQAVSSPSVAERAPCAGACSSFCGGPARGTSRSEATGRPLLRKAVFPLPPAKKEYRRKRWRGRHKPSTAAPEGIPKNCVLHTNKQSLK